VLQGIQLSRARVSSRRAQFPPIAVWSLTDPGYQSRDGNGFWTGCQSHHGPNASFVLRCRAAHVVSRSAPMTSAIRRTVSGTRYEPFGRPR
jgi:hypothetical protein